ncbi:MAG: T9SS type A sorting domain-containing protein [Flavobacteriales bacterium]|nr:T9SS type A sorting domain-containing protein [Flavobacteriales bacterium]
MQKISLLKLSVGIALAFFSGKLNAQATISAWNYDAITGAPTSTIADVGVGSSSIVGSLVVANAATGMHPTTNNGCGAQNGTNPGAWAFTANPGTTNESSGVQYTTSTVGFQGIKFTWDQRWSNTAVNTVRVQYTTDGTSWMNFDMTSANTTFCNGSIDNGRFEINTTGDQYRRITVDFSSITAANNNANFGVRVLAAHYRTTGEFRQTANTSNIATAGTWRFDNVSFTGSSPNVSIASASNFVVVEENAGMINVPITVANANLAAVDLVFGLSVYSNTVENSDFTWTSTLTIPASSNGIFNLPITILDDALAEKAERIVVKILSGTNASIHVTNNYQIIFIKDNDYQAPTPTNELNFEFLTSFSNGVSGTNSAEIVAFDPTTDRLYIANSIGTKLDIVNFANPSNPILLNSISLTPYGNINSVTVHNGVVAMAIENSNPQANGSVLFLNADGTFISQVEVGQMPDMITYNRDFTKILTANEGEPNSDYSIDPEGSVSIVDLTPGYASLTNSNVTTVGFTAYNGQEATLRAQGIRVFSSSASVAQDFEPEYIAVSEDNTKAYCVLQENNALVTIDLTSNSIFSLSALGYSSYATGSGNGLDASDQSGAVLITGDLPIKGAYMPDAMTYKTIGNQGYIFTANEGDSREFGSVIDANRLSSATFNNLDAAAFPDAYILRNNKFLGRLNALKYSGDTDGDGDFDEIHVMGGRSFSIFNPIDGTLVWDSKDIIEQITSNHPTFSAIFNASNSTGTPTLKNRSDDKGPEPEGITVQTIYGKNYAFVSLERIGGVMIFNVDIPTNPVFVGYANNRSTTVSGPDLGAEGIIFIPAAQSPNGNDILILANEVSSTLSIYQINSCAVASGATISAVNPTICQGQSTQLSVTSVPTVSYQWIKDGQVLANQGGTTLSVNQAGNYKVAVSNTTLGCTDTSAVFAVTVNPLPIVSAGNNQTICGGTPVTLSASGATTYSWNNGVNGAQLLVNTGTSPSTSVYTVTGIDATTNCFNTAQVSVIVLGLPTVEAGLNQLVCANDSVTLTASGAVTYTWNNGISNATAFVPSADTLFYTVEGIDANNCTNQDSVMVVVNALPTVSAGMDVTVCSDAIPVNLVASSSDASINFLWNTNAVFPNIQVNTSGVYTVTVTNSNGCSKTDSVAVIINSNPSVTINGDLSVCSNDLPISLTSQVSTSGTNYLWSNSQTTSTIEVTIAGTYSLIFTDANNCQGFDTVAVLVNTSPTVNAGNDVTVCENELPVTLNATGNGSSVNWNTQQTSPLISVSQAGIYTVTTTASNGCQASDAVEVIVENCASIDELELIYRVYPNPTNSILTLISTLETQATIEVYNLEGKVVYQTSIEGIEKQMDLSEISKGTYLLKISNSNQSKTLRIIKL